MSAPAGPVLVTQKQPENQLKTITKSIKSNQKLYQLQYFQSQMKVHHSLPISSACVHHTLLFQIPNNRKSVNSVMMKEGGGDAC